MQDQEAKQQQPPVSTVPPLEPVPSDWPGAFGAYKHSAAAVFFNVKPLLILYAFTILASIADNIANPRNDIGDYSPASSLVSLLVALINVLLSIAMSMVLIRSIKRQKIELEESLQIGISKYVSYFLLSVLLALISFASVLAFVIPAFFIIPRLVLAPYFLLEGGLGVFDSVSASWAATRGNVGKVWGIFGVTILMTLIFVTIIGIPVAIYLLFTYSAALPLLYFFLKKNQPTVAAPQAPTPPIS